MQREFSVGTLPSELGADRKLGEMSS